MRSWWCHKWRWCQNDIKGLSKKKWGLSEYGRHENEIVTSPASDLQTLFIHIWRYAVGVLTMGSWFPAPIAMCAFEFWKLDRPLAFSSQIARTLIPNTNFYALHVINTIKRGPFLIECSHMLLSLWHHQASQGLSLSLCFLGRNHFPALHAWSFSRLSCHGTHKTAPKFVILALFSCCPILKIIIACSSYL